MSLTALGWDDYPALSLDSLLPVILVTSGMAIGGAVGLLFVSVKTFMKGIAAHRQVVITFALALANLLLLLCFCLIQIIMVRDQVASESYRAFGPLVGPSTLFVASSTTGLRRARVFLEQTMMIVGDFVVLGRARAIYSNQRWIGNILFILWLICVGWGIAFYTLLSINIDKPETYSSLNAYACVFMAFSATVNVLATGLIAWRLWSYRKFLKKEMGIEKPRRTKAQRALFTMVESGCIFRLSQITSFLFGIIVIDNSKIDSTKGFVNALSIVQQLFYIICGIYPASVWILLSVQRRSKDHHNLIDWNSS